MRISLLFYENHLQLFFYDEMKGELFLLMLIINNVMPLVRY